MVRVLSLNYEYPPIGGGGGNAHQALMKEFSAMSGLEITLVTSTTQKKPYSEKLSSRATIHYLPIPKKHLRYWRRNEVIQYVLTQYGFLRHYTKKVPFDVCHAFFGFPTGLLAYLMRKHFPYIVSVRGSDVPGFNQRFSWDYVMLRPLLRRVYKNAYANVANSQGLSNLFSQSFSPLPVQVIPNGVDTTFFQPTSPSSTDDAKIVVVARLIPRKGIDLLLEACSLVKKSGISFQCHIVGDGPEEANLKKQCSSLGLTAETFFHGSMTREQLAQFLPTCSMFVMPSYAEGMCNAALEAMACGLPLILTHTGGSFEMINSNGYIVPTGEVEPLAEKIQHLLTHPEQRVEMGLQSSATAQNFSWHNVAKSYFELFDKAAQSTHKTN